MFNWQRILQLYQARQGAITLTLITLRGSWGIMRYGIQRNIDNLPQAGNTGVLTMWKTQASGTTLYLYFRYLG